MVRPLLWWLGCAWLGLGGGLAQAADFQATVDRRTLAVDEHVMLTLTLSDSDTRLRAEGVDPNIDLSPLHRDFDVGRPQTSHRYNVERPRGRSTSSLVVALFPKHPGALTIPGFRVDGLASGPIRVEVIPAAGDRIPEVFARSHTDVRRPWQRQQVVISLDLYHRIELQDARLGAAIEVEPREVELYSLPQTTFETRVDGVGYRVTRSRWALTPLRTGPLQLLLPDIWLTTADGRQRRLAALEERLEVRPLPPGVGPEVVVGIPRLVSETFDPQAVAGRAQAWQIELTVDAGLNALPTRLADAATDGAPEGSPRVYMDTAEKAWQGPAEAGDEVRSLAVYKGYVIPGRAGRQRLPTFRIPYFDPARATPAVLEIGGHTLEVGAAPVGAATPPASPSPSGSPRDLDPWPWVAAALLCLWLATLGFVAWRLRPPFFGWRRAGVARAQGPHRHALQGRLLHAFGARTLAQGLADWERRHGVNTELRTTVEAVQRRYYGRDRDTVPAGLGTAVDRAVAIIGGPPAPPPAADPWSPSAFRRGLTPP